MPGFAEIAKAFARRPFGWVFARRCCLAFAALRVRTAMILSLLFQDSIPLLGSPMELSARGSPGSSILACKIARPHGGKRPGRSRRTLLPGRRFTGKYNEIMPCLI